MLEVRGLTKSYPSGGDTLTVVKNINFSLDAAASCAIVGPSGSGKTTLLGLCAGLDQPTSGEVHLGGVNLGELDEDDAAPGCGTKSWVLFSRPFNCCPR